MSGLGQCIGNDILVKVQESPKTLMITCLRNGDELFLCKKVGFVQFTASSPLTLYFHTEVLEITSTVQIF